MQKDKRVEKKKTVTIKSCLNPIFNESFPFEVPAHVLRETTIIITVMDKDRLSRNDVIGKVLPFYIYIYLEIQSAYLHTDMVEINHHYISTTWNTV